MALILEITSEQRQTMGASKRKEFDERGGTIGRGRDNDWVLPDADRIISSRHATVVCQGGKYFIADTSANGVYLNDADEAVGNGNRAPLSAGDTLHIGDYDISVAITAARPEPATSFDLPGGGDDSFLPDSLDPLELLEGLEKRGSEPPPPEAEDEATASPWAGDSEGDESPWPSGPSEPDWLSGRSSESDHVPAPEASFTPPSATPEHIPEDWDLTGFNIAPSKPSPPPPSPEPRRQIPPEPSTPEEPVAPPRAAPPPVREVAPEPRPAPAPAPPAPAPAAPSPPRVAAGAADAGGVEAFLRGLGLERESVPAAQSGAFLEQIGKLFRDCVQDLREVLMARSSLKSGFRMEMTMIRQAENNPLKFSAGGVDECLQNMLFSRAPGYLTAERAMHEGFQDLKDHQVATMAGMQAAFKALLERFEPEKLEQKFDKTNRGWALLDMQKKGAFWDAYKELFQAVREQSEEDFQALFGDEFSRAYEAQIRSLQKARKKGSG